MAREMKNSGVRWIGDIPSNWILTRGQFLYSITTGKLDVNAENPDGLYPFFTCSMYPKKIDSYAFDCEALLVAGNGLVGYTNYYKGKFNAYQRTYVLNNFRGINPIFLKYYVSCNLQTEVAPKSSGSVIQFIKLEDLQHFNICLPSETEQKVIADFLDAKCVEIDGLLADLDAEVNTLTEYKKSIIAETVTRGLNPNAPMKSSGIPWAETIPAHWGVEPVYTHFHDKIFLNLDYEYQRAFKFKYGTLEYKNEVGDLTFYMPTYIKYSKVKKGDIIINGLNLNYDFISQRVAITPEDGIITSAYLAIRPLEGVIPSYFCYLFKAMDNMKLFHGMGKGIRLTLSFDELKRVRIPIPNKNEQIEIANYLDSKCAAIDQAITDKTQQIETLKAYKSSLIYEYVTGKKQVAL